MTRKRPGCRAVSASAPTWQFPRRPHPPLLFPHFFPHLVPHFVPHLAPHFAPHLPAVRQVAPAPKNQGPNSGSNSQCPVGAPATRSTDREGQLRAGRLKPAAHNPSALGSNPRTMPSPSRSLAPPLRPTPSHSPAPRIGNTPAGSGSRDDRPAQRILRAPAGVQPSRFATPSALVRRRFSTGDRCAHTTLPGDQVADLPVRLVGHLVAHLVAHLVGRLVAHLVAHYRLAPPTSERRRPETRTTAGHEVIRGRAIKREP